MSARRRRAARLFAVAAIVCASAWMQAAGAGLAEAVKAGDRAAVRALLKSGAEVNAPQPDGMTALHWAALGADGELTRLLIEAGANTKATTRLGGYTPLLLAARNGNAASVRALAEAGADPNAATTTGTTPLMLASASGSTEAVGALLEHGASVDAREGTSGQTAAGFAAAAGRAAVIRMLAAAHASLGVTSKVVDLTAYTEEPDYTGNGGRPARGRGRGEPGKPQTAGVDRRYSLSELVGAEGGLTPLLLAARQGHADAAAALLDGGADVNQPGAGDGTTALLIAIINGHFDLAKTLLDRGAESTRASRNGVTPLYAVLNCQWAPNALYPQPRAYEQQHVSYLDLMTALLDAGADPNARLRQKVWYSGYNTDFSGVDEQGATPFWRAAYAADVDAMKLLVARGADPYIPTARAPGRIRTGDLQREIREVSPLPPVPVGGPAVDALLAASGVGYGEGFAGNSHRFAPGGMLAAVKYLVEDLHMDVNAVDQDGNTALHNAASRGDNEMILYLVSKGADVKAVNREGKTTVDMANGPVQRISPFPETIALLEKLGAKNNHTCVSC
ncbi:MAG TPA: ankyrin repeat domain-containing protein [Vicinamibacterales bacterium]|nr:ankyrin repeat domain-containing protein [Vicinamibacterales bacterium]